MRRGAPPDAPRPARRSLVESRRRGRRRRMADAVEHRPRAAGAARRGAVLLLAARLGTGRGQPSRPRALAREHPSRRLPRLALWALHRVQHDSPLLFRPRGGRELPARAAPRSLRGGRGARRLRLRVRTAANGAGARTPEPPRDRLAAAGSRGATPRLAGDGAPARGRRRARRLLSGGARVLGVVSRDHGCSRGRLVRGLRGRACPPRQTRRSRRRSRGFGVPRARGRRAGGSRRRAGDGRPERPRPALLGRLGDVVLHPLDGAARLASGARTDGARAPDAGRGLELPGLRAARGAPRSGRGTAA